MDASTIVRRKEGVLSTKIDGEAVLMNVDSGNYFTLNTVGSVIWDLLESSISVSQLQEELLERFDGDRETILSESKAYIHDLTTKGLIA